MSKMWPLLLLGFCSLDMMSTNGEAAELDRGVVYQVSEISFSGPQYGPADNPVKDVDFWVRFRHTDGTTEHKIHGFWDGDGKGGTSGNVFKVRFCPTKRGRWTLLEVHSNKTELAKQRQGDWLTADSASGPPVRSLRPQHPGFWVVDTDSPGQRWYKRSNGSHPYIFGNTMYSFLSERDDKGPHGSNIAADVIANAPYFKKIRFSLHGDRYPHPTDKPFLDNEGKPTDSGDFSHRPHPAWFSRRVDVAVQTAYNVDLIADLILNGPDTMESRSILRAAANGNDPTPWLKYVAARYGSYPNVWFCLSNEWDIKMPQYTPEQVAQFGAILRSYLAYPIPVSIHAVHNWHATVNRQPAWNDHIIVQDKLKRLNQAADANIRNYELGGSNKPVINDEPAYEGAGDGWSEEDVIESHLGAFLGGGYATTGHKPGNKKGHYFWGNFKAAEHKAVDNLQWLSGHINTYVTFWKMQPVKLKDSIFANVRDDYRAMQWADNEYVLGTNEARQKIAARLPPGTWEVRQFDAIAMRESILSNEARGTFTFDTPASRAVMVSFKKK